MSNINIYHKDWNDIIILDFPKNTDINRNANEGLSLFSGEHLCSPENTTFYFYYIFRFIIK